MEIVIMFIVIFIALSVIMGGMMIGLARNKPLKGSCGGLANYANEPCPVCHKKAGETCV